MQLVNLVALVPQYCGIYLLLFLYVYYAVIWIVKCGFGEFGILGWYFDARMEDVFPEKNYYFPRKSICRSVIMRCIFAFAARVDRAWTLWNTYIIYYSRSNYIWLRDGEDIALETLPCADRNTGTYASICYYEFSRGWCS